MKNQLFAGKINKYSETVFFSSSVVKNAGKNSLQTVLTSKLNLIIYKFPMRQGINLRENYFNSRVTGYDK